MTELARVNVGDGGYGQNQLILSYELVSQSIEKNSSMVKFQISLYCPVWINTTSSKLVIDSSAGSIGEVSVGPSWNAGTHVLWTNGNTGWELGHKQDGTIDYTLSAKIVSTFLLSGTVSSKIPIPTIPRYATANQSLNSKTENTITMNWSSDSTIDYIWYSTNNGSTWKGVDVTDGTSGTYKITGLSPNTSYNIKTRVRRKDSQLTTDSTALAVTTYKVPTNTLSSKTETKITVNWSVDSTADYIWYSINNGSSWVAVGSVNATSGSYTISNLSPNTTYTIKTRVRRKATQTTYDTSAISVTTYKVPTNALKSKTETSITMNWSADSTVDYIWYSKDNGANWTGIDVTDGTSGSYTISGLSANTSYNVKTRIRRKATQTTYDCSTINVNTYDFPHLTSLSNFIIGGNIICTLYNPLNRTVSLKFYGNDNSLICTATRNTNGETSIGNNTNEIASQYKSIPNSKSGLFYCNVIYDTVTKKSNTAKYSINEANCKPTFNNFTYADTDSTITSLTGNNQILVNNNSNCKFTISTANKAVGKNSASIVKYKFEWGNKSSEANYSSSAEVTSTINDSTGNTLKVTAIDSRGLSATVTKTITNVAYINATVDEVNIQRLNGIDVETYLGLKLNIWKGNWQNGSNTAYDNQLKYVAYRVYDGSAWTNYFDITSAVKTAMSSSSSGSTTTITVPLSKSLAIHANGTSGGFTIGKSYTIQVLIKDGTSSSTFTPSSYQATKQGTVPDGKVGFSRYKDSDGNYHYAINGMPEDYSNLKVHGNISATGDVSLSLNKATGNSTAPVSGAIDGITALTDMKNYKTFLGSLYMSNGGWYNVISTRHRNGHSDGGNYGMMIYSKMTSTGNLFWNKQTGATTWQGERTILDSSNYSNYALPLSGGALTGHLYLNGITDSTTTSTSMIIFGNSTTQYGVIRANTNGAILISNSKTDNTKAIAFEPKDSTFKSSTDAKISLGSASYRWNGVYSSGDMYVTKGSGDTYIHAKRSDTGTEVAFGVGSGGANHGIWSYKMNKWLVYSDGTNGYLNGTATNATKAKVTNTNPTSMTRYYPTWITDAGESVNILANNGLTYSTLQGTASAVGRAMLTLGNDVSTGKAGNKRGEIRLYSEKNGNNILIPVAGITSSYTNYLPQHSGYISSITSLYSNSSGTTGTVTLSESASNFSYIEIFYKNDTGNINSTKVFIPNGNVALLETAFITKESNGNKTIQHQSKTVLISGTSISNTGTNPYIVSNVSHNGSSGSTWTDFTNSVKIIKVIGYK